MSTSQDLILCVDIGGTSIKASQFFCAPDGNLVLEKFAYVEYSVESDEANTEAMFDALSEIITQNGFDAKITHVSISGQSSFTRFIKVPSMTTDKNKIKEIVAYEAKQSIPFPMDEVVWDSQLIEPAEEGADDNEIDALLAIVKNEVAIPIVERIESLGKEVKIIEVSPTACYNAARANAVGNTQCEMILNIGGKFSSLIFVDGGRFFVRSIPIAGVTITQQIAKEFNIPFADAEEMKRRHGFVALGGAYEEPESEVAATVSKIVRNIMTRLHAEINRSINIYRASQHGRKPEKLFLTGGSSILAFTPRFFSEKLRVPVEYFNPFQVVTLAPDIDQTMLRDVAHLFSEMVGLALRHIGNPPISISLIPDSIRKQHVFNLKQPFFYASAVSLLLYLGISFWAFHSQYSRIQNKSETIQNVLDLKRVTNNAVQRANTAYMEEEQQFTKITQMLEYRDNWIDFFDQLQKLIPSNVWFTKITVEEKPLVAAVGDANPKSATSSSDYQEDEFEIEGRGRGFGRMNSFSFDAQPQKDEVQKNINAVKWLNMEGYIVCEKGIDDRLPETNVAIGLLSDHLKDSGLFVTSAIPSFKQDIYLYNFNITKFRYSIELLKPINSMEYTQILRDPHNEKKQENKD